MIENYLRTVFSIQGKLNFGKGLNFKKKVKTTECLGGK